MTTQNTAYQMCFEQAQAFLNRGEHRTALTLFETAREMLSSSNEGVATTPEVAQQIGICLRLIGNRPRRPFEDRIAYRQQQSKHYENAEEAFEEALKNCGDKAHKAAILRDQGMLYLNWGRDSEAQRLISESCAILEELHQASDLEDRGRLRLEYAVSLGFQARSLMKTNPHRALDLFRRTHKFVQGDHDIYELNNLAWYQKVAPIHERIGLAARGIQLACRTGNNLRVAQMLIQVPLPRAYPR